MLIISRIFKQLNQNIEKILSVSFPVSIGKNNAPENSVSGNLGLIRKKSLEGIAVFLIIRRINLIQKNLCRLRI